MPTSHGILPGFGFTPKHIDYYDLTSHHDKISTHHIIDEPHHAAFSYRTGT